MIEILVCGIVTILESISIWLAYILIFCMKSKKIRGWRFSYFFVVFLISIVIYHINDAYLPICRFLSNLFIPFIISCTNIKQWFLLFFPIYQLVSSLDMASVFVVSAIKGKYMSFSVGSMYLLFSVKILTIIVLVVLIKIRYLLWGKENENVLSKWQMLSIYAIGAITTFLVSEASFFVETGSYSEKSIRVLLFTNAFVVVFIFLLSIYVNHLRVIQERQNTRLFLFEQYKESQKKYIDDIILQDHKMRLFKHDLNAHLRHLSTLSSECNSEEIRDYCLKIISEAENSKIEMFSGDISIDAILSFMKTKAIHEGIDTVYHIQVLESYGVDPYDICSILSNILQNAIEGIGNIEQDRVIELTIMIRDDVLSITCKNPTDNNLEFINGRPITNKEDVMAHGFGSENVSSCVSKYNGKMSYAYDKGSFIVAIVIPVNNT